MNAELAKLPLDARLRLVEELWDSIAAEQGALPLTAAQRSELDRRMEAYARDGSEGRLALDAIAEIRRQL